MAQAVWGFDASIKNVCNGLPQRSSRPPLRARPLNSTWVEREDKPSSCGRTDGGLGALPIQQIPIQQIPILKHNQTWRRSG